MIISQSEILLRLLLAAGLGALVGFEREEHGQSAGLRTHMILAVGATLAMTLSINLSLQFLPTAGGDPTRLAAQVISGIGFLGAGAILRYGASIRGLTTATSLWTLAIVGLAVGAGEYMIGAVTTLFLLIILSLLDLAEKHLVHANIQVPLVVVGKDDLLRIDDLKALLAKHKIEMSSLFVSKNLKKHTIRLRVMILYRARMPIQTLLDDLSALPGVHTFQLGEPAQQL
jgi:putative Mg2+ transporter-C (MgtC) family protein